MNFPRRLIAILAVAFPMSAARAADWLVDPAPFRAIITTNQAANEVSLENGLVRRALKLSPEAATVAFDNLTTGAGLLRLSVRPEAQVEIGGEKFSVGGLDGQPVHNYLDPAWLAQMTRPTSGFHFTGLAVGRAQSRFPWRKNVAWLSSDPPWPPPGAALTLTFAAPPSLGAVSIDVHYEIYDGLPIVSKWLTLHNDSAKSITLNSFVAEQLAFVEQESMVDSLPTNYQSEYRAFDVFSDYAFGMSGPASDAPAIHWKPDPLYTTQVNYLLQTPCLLECSPPLGPDVAIKPGESFNTFRVFELAYDSFDRERRGLEMRRAYRSLAPWTQESPILMHVRDADPEAVKTAVDQCAAVGFELVIMSFGSGFDIENEDPKYLAQMKQLASYARNHGIALGGYSLLASRSIDATNDVINPQTGKTGGARFGNSPCLGSVWGQDYFRKLRQFFDETGCNVLEHDGSYPGDVCASTNHPGHTGLADSQWKQWKVISGFYEWCRARGIYLNVPDWYVMAGSSKTGMGYRETDWSLPRAQQEIIERQNIFDGTWEKAPSMGWMFVPLTEYQGGGEAATIEPLHEHLPHYETRLANLFGAGVQACYRGPRLFDTDKTKAVVKRWVDFYKQHRAILDSDIIHLRRADGRDWDGWLHVNPALAERGLAMFYNPLVEPITRRIHLPLYYTGLTSEAIVRHENGAAETLTLARDDSAEVSVQIPARDRTWVTISAPP